MYIADYPENLPLPQTASKGMQADTGYISQIPERGPPVFIPLTRDNKYQWSVRWVFQTLKHDDIFQRFLNSSTGLNKTANWFRMPIFIGGFGLQEQIVHFVGYPKQTSTGRVTIWEGQIIAYELNYPGKDSEAEFGFYEHLDELMNRIIRIPQLATKRDSIESAD